MEDRTTIMTGATPPANGGRRSPYRHVLGALALVVVVLGSFAVARPTQSADIALFIGITLGSVLQYIIGFLGTLLLYLVKVLINVASYNGFVTSVAVENGWTIVRDVTNMFFILVLLVIAFGTILGADQWSYKNKRLSNLLIMAVVVNFSRTICGLLIDFSQVVMLTFVYGFKEAAGGNFVEAFAINKIMQEPKGVDKEAATTIAFKVVIALLLGLFMVLISMAVVIYLTIMLVIRIVYLWLLIVMSPLAFFMKVVPGSMASGQYGKWWEKFNSQLVFGPVMAFFLWLSLVTVSDSANLSKGFDQGTSSESAGGQMGASASEAFAEANIQQFVIAICLLVGGAMMANQMAGATGKSAMGAVTGAPKVAKTAYRAARSTAAAAGRAGAAASRYIPAGRTDPSTGIRPTLYDRGAAIGQLRQEKKAAKTETKEDKVMLGRAAALKSMGKTDAAAAIEKDVMNRTAGRLGKNKSVSELRSAMDDGSLPQGTRQAAMLALAQKGDESLKGKGAALSQKVGSMGGSKDFELQMRQALAAKGDPDAMVTSAKIIQDRMASSSARQNANSLEGVANGVQLGADGKPKQTHAVDRLLNIDKDQYDTKDFSNKLKQQIQDALLVAANLDANKAIKPDLENKYKELTGTSMADPAAMARASELMAAAGGAGLKSRLGAAESGKAKYSAVDTAAANLVSSNEEGRDATDRVRNMRERLAGGESVDSMRDEIASVMGAFKDSALAASAVQGVSTGDLRNADGKAMGADEVVDAAQFMKDLQAAQGASDQKAAADHLKAASLALEDAARKSAMSPADRQRYSQQMQNGVAGFQKADAGFEKALGTAPAKEKLSAAHKAANEGAATINLLIKQAGGGISKDFKGELDEIKKQLKSIKSMKTIGETESKILRDIKKKLTAAQRKIT